MSSIWDSLFRALRSVSSARARAALTRSPAAPAVAFTNSSVSAITVFMSATSWSRASAVAFVMVVLLTADGVGRRLSKSVANASDYGGREQSRPRPRIFLVRVPAREHTSDGSGDHRHAPTPIRPCPRAAVFAAARVADAAPCSSFPPAIRRFKPRSMPPPAATRCSFAPASTTSRSSCRGRTCSCTASRAAS